MPAPPAEVQSAGGVKQTGLGNPAELLWNLIIRPPRSSYKKEQLGPTFFRVDRRAFVRRTDVQLRNPRGHALECSFFEPLQQQEWEMAREEAASQRDLDESGSAWSSRRFSASSAAASSAPASPQGGSPLPCVIFLHGNSSCRLEALPLVPLLAPLWISLLCFDFSGCGLSEGEFISLGWYERDDLAACIEYLRSLGRVSTIALWGRSMGAFTALLHSDRDPSIAGLVLDSPFSSLKLLAEELASSYAKVPAWMVRAVLTVVRTMIKTKAGFDIEDLEGWNHVNQAYSPALFIAATGDDFILPHHAQDLHEAYQGEKEMHLVSGDHNSARPLACRRKAALFLCRTFHDKRLDRLLDLHTSGLFDIFSAPSAVQAACVEDQDGRSDFDGGDEGALVCQQVQLLPGLQNMMLIRQNRCRRPFVTKTHVKLMQEQSEAGFFIRLESADMGGEPGQPLMLVLTVTASALLVSRVCDDSLETLAAGAGLQPRQARALAVGIDRSGRLQFQLGDEAPLQFDCGSLIRQEVSVWLMLLAGQTTFGNVSVEDGEATLREHLGDVLLRSRHLGGPSSQSLPAPIPRGDSGFLASPAPPTPPSTQEPEAASPVGGDGHGPELRVGALFARPPDEDVGQVRRACEKEPEALIGWRVRVGSLGEGVVVGVQRRFGRATQHLVALGDDENEALPLAITGVASTPPRASGTTAATTPPPARRRATSVTLRRKDSRWSVTRGLEFEPLWREF